MILPAQTDLIGDGADGCTCDVGWTGGGEYGWQAAARARGKRWGGSKAGKIIKTSATPEQVSTIKRMGKEGSKIAAIARATGLSRPTVYKYL